MKKLSRINAEMFRLWKRFVLRGLHYSSNYKRLDWLYFLKDPWKLTSPVENYRFEKTNELILQFFGKINSLLEVGCGEGFQSVHLVKICNELIGIDVSHRAIERAKLKCPKARYFCCDIYSDEILKYSPYNLVVACEVLYYVKDVLSFLTKADQLGEHCFFSYIVRESPILDAYIRSMKKAQLNEISFSDIKWRVAWW